MKPNFKTAQSYLFLNQIQSSLDLICSSQYQMSKINSQMATRNEKPTYSSKVKEKVLSKVQVSNNQDFDLKLSSIQKQIDALNLDIKCLFDEKKFIEGTHKVLQKERKVLQSNFLYKNFQKAQERKTDELVVRQQQNPTSKIKNIFRDVNQPILQFAQQVQTLLSNDHPLLQRAQHEEQINSQISQRRLPCQSLHLKQIFGSQIELNNQQKLSSLQERLSLLYQIIRTKLQKEQPYINQKIFERIKRKAHKQTKYRLLTEIQRLTKQNSAWINRQTNKISNQLQEKQVQEICISNLQLMKKIISKKIQNNDFIFENYSQTQGRLKPSMLSSFPVQTIQEKYKAILQKFKENRISFQLNAVKKSSSYLNNDESLLEELSKTPVANLLIKQKCTDDSFGECQKQLLQRCQKIRGKIDKLLQH